METTLFIVILNLIVSIFIQIEKLFSNICHLDILIDYQGQLKFTDFGAAKILAKGQKTMGRATMNMHVNSLAGTPMYMVMYLQVKKKKMTYKTNLLM